MRIGSMSGVGAMSRSTRSNTIRRKPEGPVIQAPPQHSIGMQAEPRRQYAPKGHRKGLMA